jgi:hypothetical protein
MFANRTIRGVKVPCAAIYIVAVLAIVSYGIVIRKYKIKDRLEKPVINHPSCPGFDGWGGLHFLFFGIIGYMFPGHYVQCLAVSLLWEGIEHGLGTNKIEMSGKRLQLIGDQEKDGTPIPPKDEQWWYGRFTTDPAFNMAGYILGSALGNRYWPVAASDR